jgi:hypothetical protein
MKAGVVAKKDPNRVAAGRKAARTRKRQGNGNNPSKRKRVLSNNRKGLMGQLFPAGATRGAANAAVSGAVGGAIAGVLTNVAGTRPIMDQIIMLGFTSFIFGATLGMPNTGAGIAGVVGYKLFDEVIGLSENNWEGDMEYTNWVEEGALSQNVDYALSDNYGMSQVDYALSQDPYGMIPMYNY